MSPATQRYALSHGVSFGGGNVLQAAIGALQARIALWAGVLHSVRGAAAVA